MPKISAVTFTNPKEYHGRLRELGVVPAAPHTWEFVARLTWVELSDLLLVRAQENSPEVTRLTSVPNQIMIVFPMGIRPSCLRRGRRLGMRDMVFQRCGERAYQFIGRTNNWGMILVSEKRLLAHGKAFAGRDFELPEIDTIFRPARSAGTCLRNLHRKICRVAEMKSHIIVHAETARAIENELLDALVKCLMSVDDPTEGGTIR